MISTALFIGYLQNAKLSESILQKKERTKRLLKNETERGYNKKEEYVYVILRDVTDVKEKYLFTFTEKTTVKGWRIFGPNMELLLEGSADSGPYEVRPGDTVTVQI
jgi:hypothetical protein